MNETVNQASTDEISLYDIWNIIAKRKKLFIAVFILIFLAGLVFALITPKKYAYSQAMQVASYVDSSGNTKSLTDPKVVISSISDIYSDVALNQYNNSHADNMISLSANDFDTKDIGGATIRIIIKGTEKQQPIYVQLLQSILQQTQQETAPLLKMRKQYLQTNIDNAQARLEFYIDANKNLLTTIQDHAITANKENSSAFALMSKQQLMNFQTQQKDTIAALQNQINDMQQQLSSLQDAHFTTSLIRSAKSIGVSHRNIMLLVMILAFILAIMSVFAAEFFAKARQLKKTHE